MSYNRTHKCNNTNVKCTCSSPKSLHCFIWTIMVIRTKLFQKHFVLSLISAPTLAMLLYLIASNISKRVCLSVRQFWEAIFPEFKKICQIQGKNHQCRKSTMGVCYTASHWLTEWGPISVFDIAESFRRFQIYYIFQGSFSEYVITLRCRDSWLKGQWVLNRIFRSLTWTIYGDKFIR